MLPTLLCLQICALLFASLYILCHFIITHFKKHADFAAGRRMGAATFGATFSLPRACSSIAIGAPGGPGPSAAQVAVAPLTVGRGPSHAGGSRARTPWECFCSIWSGQGAMLRAALPPPAPLLWVCLPQFMMMRMLLSTGLRKFLPILLPACGVLSRFLSLPAWDVGSPQLVILGAVLRL